MIALAWGIAAGFLVLAAALRLAGASLVRTPRADALHDAADGIAGAKVVAELLEDRARIQPSISLIHSALLVPAALAAAWAPATLFGGWMLVLSLILSGGAIVIIGEWLPRSLGRKHPRRIAYRFAHLLKGSIGAGERAVDLIYDEEEDENNQKGEANGDHDVSDREEIRMISSVLEFSDAIVREVMVPRTDMMMLSADRTTNEALNLIIEHGYSRIPITGRGADDIVGMVYAKTFSTWWAILPQIPHWWRSAARPTSCRKPNRFETCYGRCSLPRCILRWWWTSSAGPPGWSRSKT